MPARAASVSLSGKDPAAYKRHALHSSERSYQETNCYADVLVELLHACDYEPMALFAHVVRMDFEGDQWTFFKPPPEDIELLFGVDVHEMQPYRPLPLQIEEQLELGRTLIVEYDSFYLPDTAATSYRTAHVKSSVAADAIDGDAQTMNYFHGPGLFSLGPEDYRGIFRLLHEVSDDVLPPYTELVRFDSGPRLEGDELRAASLETLRRHLARRPADNPVERFGAALGRELPNLLQGDLDDYHAYAFATVRLAGSGFEALGSYVDWLFGSDGTEAREAIAAFVDACKVLSFRLARRREFDPQELIGTLASSWERATVTLDELAS
jgi:hypothetical protein